MTIALKLLALAAATALASAPAPTPDWRFVVTADLDADLSTAVYIDAGSIIKEGNRVRFSWIKVINKVTVGINNLTANVDADCAALSFHETGVKGNLGGELVLALADEPQVDVARPDTPIHSAIDTACGVLALDRQTIADPIADGRLRFASN